MHGKVKKIGVISIGRSYANRMERTFDNLYAAVGRNTGNLMFTEASYSLLEGQVEQIGFSFNPASVNDAYDCVVVPAANWLNKNAEWGWLISQLEQLTIPVVTIGIGLQADTLDIAKVEVSESALRLAHTLSKSAPMLSVRGDFTRDWLKSIGIDNAVTTGCPSLYMNMFDQAHTAGTGKLVLQATRYNTSKAFLNSKSINRQLFALSGALDLPMIYQSEYEEMELLHSGFSAATLAPEACANLAGLYGLNGSDEMDAYLARNANVFYDLKEWSAFVGRQKGVLGTRLHGSVIALNSGKPAVLVPHDSRTAEVANFAGITTAQGPTVQACQTLEDLDSVLATCSMERYRDTRSRNQTIFIRFLQDVGLTPRLTAMF